MPRSMRRRRPPRPRRPPEQPPGCLTTRLRPGFSFERSGTILAPDRRRIASERCLDWRFLVHSRRKRLFNHVMLGTNDLDRAGRFYAAVLGVLGLDKPPFASTAASGHRR